MRLLSPVRVLVLLLCAVVTAASAQAQIRVAVENGGTSTASAAAVAAQLNDDTWFDFTATVVTASQIDTVAELNNYDVVLLGDSGNDNPDWTAPMAAALRTWVESGHGAVATGWFNYALESGDPGDADLEAIFPTQNIPSDNEYTDITDTIDFSGSHPIIDGLTDFAPTLSPTPSDPCCIEVNTFAAESGDTVLATGGGTPDFGTIVASKDSVGSGGRTAYLGPVYFGDGGYADATAALRVGQGDRLLEQAVAWAAGESATAPVVPVPALSPASLALLAALLAAGALLALRATGA